MRRTENVFLNVRKFTQATCDGRATAGVWVYFFPGVDGWTEAKFCGKDAELGIDGHCVVAKRRLVFVTTTGRCVLNPRPGHHQPLPPPSYYYPPVSPRFTPFLPNLFHRLFFQLCWWHNPSFLSLHIHLFYSSTRPLSGAIFYTRLCTGAGRLLVVSSNRCNLNRVIVPRFKSSATSHSFAQPITTTSNGIRIPCPPNFHLPCPS